MASKEPTAAEQAARHLDNLAVQFNERADQDRRAANLLSAAANSVRTQQAENSKLAAENNRLVGEVAVQKAVAADSDARVKGDVELVKKILNRTYDIAAADKSASITANSAVRGNLDTAVRVLSNITAEAAIQQPAPAQPEPASVDILNVLIDGSGSMTNPDLKLNPLMRSFDAVRALSKAGKHVSSYLWGTSPLRGFNATMSSYHDVARMARGGSDFTLAAKYMRDDRMSQSFTVLSDGDLTDRDQAFREMEKLLTEVPKTIVDFVVINDRESTCMGDFAKKLADKYPSQVTFRTAGKNDSVTAILAEIAAVRDVKNKPAPKQYFMTTNKIPGLK